jgi:hypothetical protein
MSGDVARILGQRLPLAFLQQAAQAFGGGAVGIGPGQRMAAHGFAPAGEALAGRDADAVVGRDHRFVRIAGPHHVLHLFAAEEQQPIVARPNGIASTPARPSLASGKHHALRRRVRQAFDAVRARPLQRARQASSEGVRPCVVHWPSLRSATPSQAHRRRAVEALASAAAESSGREAQREAFAHFARTLSCCETIACSAARRASRRTG